MSSSAIDVNKSVLEKILEDAIKKIPNDIPYGASNKGNFVKIQQQLACIFQKVASIVAANANCTIAEKIGLIKNSLAMAINATGFCVDYDRKNDSLLLKSCIANFLMQAIYNRTYKNHDYPNQLLEIFGTGNCGLQSKLTLKHIVLDKTILPSIWYPIRLLSINKQEPSKMPNKFPDPEDGHAMLAFGEQTDAICCDPWNDTQQIYPFSMLKNNLPGSLNGNTKIDINVLLTIDNADEAAQYIDEEFIQKSDLGITAVEARNLVEDIYNMITKHKPQDKNRSNSQYNAFLYNFIDLSSLVGTKNLLVQYKQKPLKRDSIAKLEESDEITIGLNATWLKQVCEYHIAQKTRINPATELSEDLLKIRLLKPNNIKTKLI